ncbi:hypothetical protein LZL87_010538 [Fusarium oxysporum]|nr:hypothetical protein LZL87_010538 [Fusarium oxysporum]
MAALDSLPVELVANIASYLAPQDVKSLSSASWFMRHAVVRVLFRTIVISSLEASARALEEFIHKYQDFVSKIHLHIYLHPNREQKPYQGPMPSVWGTSSSDILKRIVRGEILSNINSFVVEFDPGQFELDGRWGDSGWWGDSEHLGGIYVAEDGEDWNQTLQQEREFIWRAQYNESMRTISTNHNITSLKISNLLPKNTSAWETPEWESFLGRLQVLDISVFGSGHDACWHTMPGFIEFIESLPHFIMRHARNVRHLTLEASPDGLIGGSSSNHCIPLPLKEDHFLFLHSLTLKNVMIGPDLVQFLTSRADSLEQLELYDCMCDGPDWDYGPDRELDPVTWAGLWKAIRESNMRLLKVFVVQTRTPPLMWREDHSKDFDTSEDSMAAARIRKMLEEDNNLVLWRYARVDYKYGWVVDLSDDNVKYFEEGEDQREYVKLLKVLEERNRQRG